MYNTTPLLPFLEKKKITNPKNYSIKKKDIPIGTYSRQKTTSKKKVDVLGEGRKYVRF